MKEFILCRRDNAHTNRDSVRLETKPSGDLEVVQVSDGVGDGRPSNNIIGTVPRSEIGKLIAFLEEAQ